MSTRSSWRRRLADAGAPATEQEIERADRAARVSSARSGDAAARSCSMSGVAPGRVRRRREQPDTASARGRAGARLRVRARRRPRASSPATWSAAHPITIEPAIEVGNIFQLGTRYSQALGAQLPRRAGQRAAHLDGLLRDRPGTDRRRSGRAVRRRARHLLAGRDRAVQCPPRRRRQARQRRARARGCAVRDAARGGVDVSTTTASSAPGEKFADAELLGCPLRLTVGRRGWRDRVRSEVAAPPRHGGAGGASPLARPLAGAGGAVPRRSPEQAPAARPRPLRTAAAADGSPTRHCAHGRSRTRSASRALR